MNFLHYEFDLSENESVEVVLDSEANVRLLDDTNFELYRSGKQHRYYGGYAKESPAVIPAPRSGHWHLVVDLGGFSGTISATARVLQETL